jgi:hypothetical protein
VTSSVLDGEVGLVEAVEEDERVRRRRGERAAKFGSAVKNGDSLTASGELHAAADLAHRLDGAAPRSAAPAPPDRWRGRRG